jgi:rhodanese-related sulfurtransferase
MNWTPNDVAENRRWFEMKLRAEKGKSSVAKWAEGKPGAGDFLVLDVRGRDAFAKEHVRGAICVPMDEIEALAATLPKDRELVTYCWSDT